MDVKCCGRKGGWLVRVCANGMPERDARGRRNVETWAGLNGNYEWMRSRWDGDAARAQRKRAMTQGAKGRWEEGMDACATKMNARAQLN